MLFNRRTEITNFIITELQKINGSVSTFDVSYTYLTDLSNNVYRQIRFYDEVNDMPALYLSAGTETRNFQSENLTVASLIVTIRAYVYGEDNSQDLADSLIADIEHVIYSIGDNPEKGILDITIDNITSDEGLAAPLGLAEIDLSVTYRLEY